MPPAMRLYDASGRRLYLTSSERALFRKAAEESPREVRTFALTLLETGCRLSEALALTSDGVDFHSGSIRYETLKKRRQGVFRDVPASPALLSMLDLVHDLRDRKAHDRLWPWSRGTGWTRIIEIMKVANIAGPQASPKGLRHGFAVYCLEKNIPLTLIQKWLGHASIQTTAIYLNAVGEEERGIASRLWT
jgi:integrase/recombinase XerD